MFRVVTLSVFVVSAFVVGQSAVRSRPDGSIEAELAQVAQSSGSVPQQINHQGLVTVNGVRFNGTGSFKFAIVDPDTGVNLWCNNDNDGTGGCQGQVGAVPSAAVNLSVADGVYSVRLGEIGLANMKPVPSSVFNDDNARLRIWFDDGVNGNQQLSPDHKLTTAPYSARLPNVFVDDSGNVGIGTTSPASKLDVAGTISQNGVPIAGVPTGTVLMHASDIPPAGFLECDGSAVSRTTFADLFAVIGTRFGAGDGATTFNLPDLRGMFVRGRDSGAGNDPDAASRTAQAPGGATGDSVGSIQTDEFKFHTHTIVGFRAGNQFANGGAETRFASDSGPAGGTETRPKNVYLMFIIKT